MRLYVPILIFLALAALAASVLLRDDKTRAQVCSQDYMIGTGAWFDCIEASYVDGG